MEEIYFIITMHKPETKGFDYKLNSKKQGKK